MSEPTMKAKIRKLKDIKADLEHFGFVYLYEHKIWETANAGPFNQVALAVKHLGRALDLMLATQNDAGNNDHPRGVSPWTGNPIEDWRVKDRHEETS